MKRDSYVAQEVNLVSKYLFLGKIENTPENTEFTPPWFADFQRAEPLTKKEARKMFVKIKQAVRGKGMKLKILTINMKLDETPKIGDVIEKPAPKKRGRPKKEKAEKPVAKKKPGRPKKEKAEKVKVATPTGKKRGRPAGSKNKPKVVDVVPEVTPTPVPEIAPVQVPVVAPVETPVVG